MQLTPLELPGLLLVRVPLFRDARGFFAVRYQRDAFRAAGLPVFVQENHSRSLPGVVRGLHYQHTPPQGKLVGVVRGRVWDVVVDVRPASPTFGRHLGVELADNAGTLLWVPPGFAHGFAVLGDEPADVLYQVDAPYAPAGEAGIRWDDPDLAIRWPVADPMLSDRDRALPGFADDRTRPAFGDEGATV